MPKNRYWRALVLGTLVSAFVNSAFILAEWWAVSPHGSEAGLWLVIILVFPMLAAILALPVSLLLTVSRSTRKWACQVALFALPYAIIALVSIRGAGRLRMHAFEQLAERSAPLVEAIKKYETDHGRPPAELAELVPRYLPAIPTTGMKAYPDYNYLVRNNAEQDEGNPWVLIVSTPSGGINFDQFMYYPKQNYPKHAYSSWLERIGDWAYCHE